MSSEICCHSCGKPLQLSAGNVGRTEECPHCRSDVRVCLNCTFFDQSAYNECQEPMAERVVDKDRRNFCDYFSLASGSASSGVSDSRQQALDRLNDLFKK